MGAKDGIRGAGESHQPVSAHEGNELSERGHNTQQSPQHGAAGDNDMAHADGGLSLPLFRLLGGENGGIWVTEPSADRKRRFQSFSGGDVRASEHFKRDNKGTSQ